MTPRPISTAPHEDDHLLLLFYSHQGGWHTGIWFRGKWLAYLDTSVVLEPSHWLPVPADPPDGAGSMSVVARRIQWHAAAQS